MKFFPSVTALFHNSFIISFLVPCVPANVQGVVECSTNILEASWGPAAGAASYTATLKGAGDFFTSCPSGNHSCLFTGLQCAQTYMLSVKAESNGCNSAESAPISTTTGKSLSWQPFFWKMKNQDPRMFDFIILIYISFQHPVTPQTLQPPCSVSLAL